MCLIVVLCDATKNHISDFIRNNRDVKKKESAEKISVACVVSNDSFGWCHRVQDGFSTEPCASHFGGIDIFGFQEHDWHNFNRVEVFLSVYVGTCFNAFEPVSRNSI